MSISSPDNNTDKNTGNSSSIELLLSVDADQWSGQNLDLEGICSTAAHQVIGHLFPDKVYDLELSVKLTDNAEAQQLNAQYRGKDKPTNVLSFSADEELIENLSHPIIIGDIVMAFETIQREATDSGKSFQDHFTHLFVHGFLHLIGYTHEDDRDAENMEQLERDILSSLGIGDPYA